MTSFLSEDFLLQSKSAQRLYHDYAASMPIYDYHNHLSAKLIAEDHNYDNLTQIWLGGDHYKWRAMRTNGIDERYITGDASDYEKFQKWAETVPYCLGNPLYHWTHMELKKYFGIEKLLDPTSAKWIYNECGDMLRSPEFSVRNLLKKCNVELVCTTEDPLDSLEYHQQIRNQAGEISVHTAWRPDKAMNIDQPELFNAWTDELARITCIDIKCFDDFLTALNKRHDFFHENHCRISDMALTKTEFLEFTENEIKGIFSKVRAAEQVSEKEVIQFRTAMLIELSTMNADRNWVQQFHIGALRNNNSIMMQKLGPDTGFDAIADYPTAENLAKLLDRLNSSGKLAKTILYNLNPKDNAVIAALMGCFQDGSVPGKLQFGSGWWFLDQKTGMEQQLQTLAEFGLLSRFIGMLTDSRSFLSFPRHEYFRRILCNMLGTQMEQGLLPNDWQLLGSVVQGICYNNAKGYF